jgi:ABC-type transporter Mla subunit MlaD
MIDENRLNERIERSKRLLRRDTLDQSARTEEEISAALGRLADQVRAARDRLITRDMDHLAQTQERTRDAMSEWQNLQRRLYRLNRGIPDPESLDEISRDYRRQLQRLRDLSGQVPQMSRETGQLRDDLDRALALGNEPWKIDRGKWNELHHNLARTLRDYYDGLRAEVRDMRRRERLYLAREEEVPPEYRDLVNDYFEQLSKNRDRN